MRSLVDGDSAVPAVAKPQNMKNRGASVSVRLRRMFYETRFSRDSNQRRLTLHFQKYIHWTGKHMKLLLKRVEKAWEYGKFQTYFDPKFPELTDTKGR